MARPRKAKTREVNGEVPKPDFDLAISLYRNDIRPAQSSVGEFAQEMSTAYKSIKKDAHINPQAAKLAFKLDQMEDFKRDDFLRGLYGLMKALGIGISADLVDQMGDGEAPKMPVSDRKGPELATLQ